MKFWTRFRFTEFKELLLLFGKVESSPSRLHTPECEDGFLTLMSWCEQCSNSSQTTVFNGEPWWVEEKHSVYNFAWGGWWRFDWYCSKIVQDDEPPLL